MTTETLTAEEIGGDAPELAEALRAAGLPTDDLADSGRRFFAFRRPDGARVGFLGVEAAGAAAILRSLVVLPEWRGRGYALAMTRRVVALCRAAGIAEFYLLTTSAEALAARLGFRRVDRAAAPAAVRRSRQFAALCPDSAVLMRLDAAGDEG